MPSPRVTPFAFSWQEGLHFAQSVRVDDLVFSSGQAGFLPAGGLAGDDFESQCRQAFANLDQVLRAQGATIDSLVRLTAYLADASQYADFKRARADWLRPPIRPPRRLSWASSSRACSWSWRAWPCAARASGGSSTRGDTVDRRLSARTMRAVEVPALDAPLRVVERPVPEPGPGEVRVRVEACGVCGSDHFLRAGGFGPKVTFPRVPGHEAAGRVDALGDGVDGLAVGDQVAIYYISTPPGDPWAAAGRPNISPHIRRMGVDLDGAFAEYVVRPAEALIRPPAPVPPEVLAVLTDAVATPLHGLRRVARLQPGETLVVLGVGGLGSSAVQLGKALGARVIAVTRSAAKQALAWQLGADEVVGAADGDPVPVVRELSGGFGADVVIQCAGDARVDEQAIAMGGPGGRVVLIGAALEPFCVRAVEIFWRELAVLGSRGFVPDDIRDAIDLYLDGTIRVDHLVERVRPLEEAEEALADLAEGRVLRSVLVP